MSVFCWRASATVLSSLPSSINRVAMLWRSPWMVRPLATNPAFSSLSFSFRHEARKPDAVHDFPNELAHRVVEE